YVFADQCDIDFVERIFQPVDKEHLDTVVLDKLNLSTKQEPDLTYWRNFVNRLKNPFDEVDIALVGKYVELHDSYLSIAESLQIAAAENELKVNIHWIHSEDITVGNVERLLKVADAVLVAPGFGERGLEGKLTAVRYARENNVPFFGICLGMQVAMIEFARNVLKIPLANSTEFNPKTPDPVIDMMEEQKKITHMGGTMRLGGFECVVKRNSLVHKAYQKTRVVERHRHRYEFNNEYRKRFERHGISMTGVNPETDLVEVIEYKKHPYFLATQFHPEYQSTVENPHPLFLAFINAAHQHRLDKEQNAPISESVE
ncbi:MAG: CTP synthase, partial [Bacteroidota bacterium]